MLPGSLRAGELLLLLFLLLVPPPLLPVQAFVLALRLPPILRIFVRIPPHYDYDSQDPVWFILVGCALGLPNSRKDRQGVQLSIRERTGKAFS